MRTDTTPLVRLEDYRPSDFLIDRVELDVRLHPTGTRITATLSMKPNPEGRSDAPLVLDGDELNLKSLALNGIPLSPEEFEASPQSLTIPQAPRQPFSLTVETEINPTANTKLMGLYRSSGNYCTQCEAEGFRRITYFLDRPDVLCVYTTRIEAARSEVPVLLGNGNLVESGAIEGSDRHYAVWHDPHPKPSYLFALVGGRLGRVAKTFTTASGREVDLAIYVEPGKEDRADYALDALERSMRWDEEVFGCEYDLDVFNIVAVSDFNMGAMENKGLNIFNDKYVLASPETATDMDYAHIEAIIAHEYFHNWSGNRVTCRDWFQLSLKEGFTVLRDQLFSADMGSEAVKRIEDVRVLRSAQFPEDSGPLAHPIRPDSYQEISNFYTATVYNKGAEVIRMMRTMAGPETFRQGTDLYFDRHDGEAATCEDFVKAIEDGTGLDLAQFRLWYSQAGTPQVAVELAHEGETATLTLTQIVPATPGQPEKQPVPIPLRVALFDRDSGRHSGEQLVVLDKGSDSFAFEGFARPPVVSINRGFSAPVAIDMERSNEDLVFLAAHDDDPFARYEAMQSLVVQHLVAAVGGGLADAARAEGRRAIGEAFAAVLADAALDDLMRGELMVLPGVAYLAEQVLVADPAAIHEEREALKAWLGGELAELLGTLHDRVSALPYSRDAAARGARKTKAQALVLIAAGDAAEGARRAIAQYRAADNMTDRQSALTVLCNLDGPEREEALADFLRRYQGNALVIDKWFALQAGSFHPQVLEHIEALARHPEFTLNNPNRARALYMTAAVNPKAFHDASGAGYRMIGNLIRQLDPINPQTTARFVPQLGRWRRIEPGRAAMMRAELEKIAAEPNLSRDVREQVSKSLG
jgi:aminopeptidase N